MNFLGKRIMIFTCTACAAILMANLIAESAKPSIREQQIWKAKTKITSVDILPDGIDIKTEGYQPVYKSFALKAPPKVVLELYDAWIPTTLPREMYPRKKKTGFSLEKIRIAQFASAPTAIVRIVVDLKKVVNFHVNETDGNIKVVFKSLKTPRLKLTKTKDAAPSGKSKYEDLLTTMPKTPININFQETDLKMAMEMLISKWESLSKRKINLLTTTGVSGSISIDLRDVPFNEVFNLVLSANSLIAIQLGKNIIKVTDEASYLAKRKEARTTTKIITLNYSEAAEVKTHLDTIRSKEGRKGNILIHKAANSLIVTDTEEGHIENAKIIKKIDEKPISVSIEARIVDLILDSGMDYGVQWEYAKSWDKSTTDKLDQRTVGGIDPNTPAGGTSASPPAGFGSGSRGTGVIMPQTILPLLSGVSFGRVTNTSFLTATLSAIESKGNLKVLSNPKIVTLNNTAANISVTSQIPIVQSQIDTGGGTAIVTQTIQYKDVGITLQVTPTANAERYIKLKLTPTVSQVGQGGIPNVAPGILTRTATTEIITKDGDTAVLGGLISDRKNKVKTKVPILGDIPLIGWLFKRTGEDSSRNELLIFVTPTIVD
ncbi:AMIN domain-containing protein [Elusimicrobiota bacterium]